MDAPAPNVVLFTGTFADEDSKPEFHFEPHQLSNLTKERINRIGCGVTSHHSFLMKENGAIFGVGSNASGQLGLPETKSVLYPTIVQSLAEYKVVRAAAGRHHSAFVTEDGQVLTCGKNAMGQLGRSTKNSTNQHEPKLVPGLTGTTIQDVACGADFTVALDTNGELWSWGSPEYGQLGHGSENRTIHAGKSIFHPQPPTKIGGVLTDVKIKKVCCGTNHVLALSEKGDIFTWGFGGYGRLGHNVQKDEWRPKKVEQVRFYPVTDIAAGGAFNLAIGLHGALYTWGKTKTTGDANMHPTPELGLQGWKTNRMSCGSATLVAQADQQTVAWGMGPQGQLGFGSGRKSSAKPDIISKLDGIQINAIGCTALHTLFLTQQSVKTDALPTYTYQQLEEQHETPNPTAKPTKATTKSTAQKGKKRPAPPAKPKPTKKPKT